MRPSKVILIGLAAAFWIALIIALALRGIWPAIPFNLALSYGLNVVLVAWWLALGLFGGKRVK